LRRIAHLSDLHFGSLDAAISPALIAAVEKAEPHVVVVSGDLTQRARSAEFEAARDFLSLLPRPQVVVPGNHDIPLYNLWLRALWPLERYGRFIGVDHEPFYRVEELAVVGINTARSLTFKGGRINRRQLRRACGRLEEPPPSVVRVVVTHHPFEGASDAAPDGRVGRASMAMQSFSRCRVDLILSGHFHVHRIGASAARYRVAGYSAILAQAGTALSTRRRSQPNSFNLITIEAPRMAVECWRWGAPGGFSLADTFRFRQAAEGWIADAGTHTSGLAQDGDLVVGPGL